MFGSVGVEDLNQVKKACMESDGRISVVRTDDSGGNGGAQRRRAT